MMVKNKPLKFIIDIYGIINFVYNDKIDLNVFGKPEIHRATEVCYSNSENSWQVLSLPPLFSKSIRLGGNFNSRTEALAFEIEYLNNNMEFIINGPKDGYYPGEIQVC